MGGPRWHTAGVSSRRCVASLLAVTALVLGLSGCSRESVPGAGAAAVPAVQAIGDPSATVPADGEGVSQVAAIPAVASGGDPAVAQGVNAAGGNPASAPGANLRGPLPPAAPTGLPPGVAEPAATTGQLVTVTVSGPSATTADLRAWERQPAGDWRATIAALRVRVGTDGVGKASESSRRTPAGSYSLDQAFGRQPDPGTKLPYRHVGNDDWWVSDTRSPAYNTYQRCRIGTCRFDESAGENLGKAGASYDYALVIGYNTAKPVAGAGSAFFLHVDAGAASAGCVEVPRATVISLLRWLDPGRHPRISVTVG